MEIQVGNSVMKVHAIEIPVCVLSEGLGHVACK